MVQFLLFRVSFKCENVVSFPHDQGLHPWLHWGLRPQTPEASRPTRSPLFGSPTAPNNTTLTVITAMFIRLFNLYSLIIIYFS